MKSEWNKTGGEQLDEIMNDPTAGLGILVIVVALLYLWAS